MAIDVAFSFDQKTYRHYMNGMLTVLHCHHYLALTTKLALDFDGLDGTRILSETAEDTMYPLFVSYAKEHDMKEPRAIIEMGAAYYSVMGLGKMEIDSEDLSAVKLTRSHIDRGWIKKWELSASQINFFTCGYLAGLYAAAFGKPTRSFGANEKVSIAMGNDVGEFEVFKRDKAKKVKS